jgi:hypothetical protein
MRAKICDGARAAGIEHLEVARREVANEPSLVIAHHGRDADNVNARPERGHRLLLRQQFSCQGKKY